TPKKGGNRGKMLTDIHCDRIKEYLDNDATLSLNSIKNKLYNDFSIITSLSTLHRAIKGFHYSLKRLSIVPIRRNNRDTIESRYLYAQNFLRLLSENDGSNLIFLDECGFQVSMRKNRGRSLKGSKAISIVQNIRSKNISVCAAIVKNCVLHHKIEITAYNIRKFHEFLTELIAVLNQKGIHGTTIIMDNVPFHKNIEIQNLIENAGHNILYLPPYSPFLNPIENLFSQWKYKVKTSNCNNEDDLLRNIRLALN
ncbi:hypothetical protein DMUE_6280, partial [Dictyocoela muelleri]